MSYPYWPSDLPRYPLDDGFQYEPGSGILRTSMSAGYPKVRRRYTATVDKYSLTYLMDYGQYELFEIFVNNSPDADEPGILSGAVSFYLLNPIWKPGVGEIEEQRPHILVRLHVPSDGSPYTVAPQDSTDWIVNFTVERLP